jgi:hypothetical protein
MLPILNANRLEATHRTMIRRVALVAAAALRLIANGIDARAGVVTGTRHDR